MTFCITIRAATLDEIERTDCTDKANLTDGAAAVLVGSDLVAITNEYGTAVYRGPSHLHEEVELLVQTAVGVYATQLEHTTNQARGSQNG